MPVYHFHFVENSVVTIPVSVYMADIGAAKCEAAKTLGTMVCDAGAGAWEGRDWSVSVSDDTGLTLFSLFIVPVEAPTIRKAVMPS